MHTICIIFTPNYGKVHCQLLCDISGSRGERLCQTSAKFIHYTHAGDGGANKFFGKEELPLGSVSVVRRGTAAVEHPGLRNFYAEPVGHGEVSGSHGEEHDTC